MSIAGHLRLVLLGSVRASPMRKGIVMTFDQTGGTTAAARFPTPFQPDVGAVLDRMVRFVEDAGRLALDARSAGLQLSHKGDDLGQALTNADEAISRMMNASFGPRVIEEETADNRSMAECRTLLSDDPWTFIGDPIDGLAHWFDRKGMNAYHSNAGTNGTWGDTYVTQ